MSLTEQPRVTLIVAVYNTVKYIGQCLQSVLAQTYDKFEVIVVDDGSVDGSADVCDEYARKDRRIRVIHKENSGKADCLNIAIQQARGEFVGFVDSDDWMEPNMCEVLLEAIESTGKDCVSCGYLNEFASETVSDPVCEERQVLSSTDAIVMIYDRRLYGYLHGRLFRRSLLVEPVPHLRRYEDFAVIYKWFSHGNGLTLVPLCLYHYRQRRSSIMNSMDDRMFGFIELLEEFYHFISENNLLPERQNRALAVKNCMRIAKDIARKTHGRKSTVRLYDIRKAISRLGPMKFDQPDVKLRWRVWLLRHSVNGFKGAMRTGDLFVRQHPYNRKYYK